MLCNNLLEFDRLVNCISQLQEIRVSDNRTHFDWRDRKSESNSEVNSSVNNKAKRLIRCDLSVLQNQYMILGDGSRN